MEKAEGIQALVHCGTQASHRKSSVLRGLEQGDDVKVEAPGAPGRTGTGGRGEGCLLCFWGEEAWNPVLLLSLRNLLFLPDCIAQSTKTGRRGQPGQSLCPGVNTGPLTGISSKRSLESWAWQTGCRKARNDRALSPWVEWVFVSTIFNGGNPGSESECDLPKNTRSEDWIPVSRTGVSPTFPGWLLSLLCLPSWVPLRFFF